MSSSAKKRDGMIAKLIGDVPILMVRYLLMGLLMSASGSFIRDIMEINVHSLWPDAMVGQEWGLYRWTFRGPSSLTRVSRTIWWKSTFPISCFQSLDENNATMRAIKLLMCLLTSQRWSEKALYRKGRFSTKHIVNRECIQLMHQHANEGCTSFQQ